MKTQGKLVQKLNFRNEPEARILDSTGRLVAELDGYGSGSKAEAADARRLVACWNACEGMTIEALECMPYPFSKLLAQDFQDVVHQRDLLGEAIGKTAVAAGIAAPGVPLDGPTLLMLADDIAEDHKRLTAQRDQLLEALESIRTITDANDTENYRYDDREGCLDTVFSTATDAIAAAKAGAV